jgi:hypothetical protein
MRDLRYLAEFTPDGEPRPTQFVVDYSSDTKFILSACAWFRGMFGYGGRIIIRHERKAPAGWVTMHTEEYVLTTDEERKRGIYTVAQSDDNSTVIGHKTTSRKAALAAYPRSGTQRHRILVALTGRPMTRDDLEVALKLGGSSVHPRVLELIEGGWVEEMSETRKTRRGQDALLLKPTQKGYHEAVLARDRRRS